VVIYLYMERTKQTLSEKAWKQRYLLAMVIPGILFMLVFNYAPMYGIVIAFTKFNIVKPIFDAPWVGFRYFIEFFEDERFWLVLGNTLGISLLKLAIAFPLPIVFALMINEVRQKHVKRWVQTISYLPHFLSWVVLGGIMINWLADVGLVNQFLLGVGVIKDPIVFLAEPGYFWGLSVISEVWKELGWSAIIYLAAMAGIDPEMYEAARIDGAGRFARIWHITLPCIAGTVAILFILAVSGLMNSNFDQIFVLKNPLNADASDVIDIFVYRMGLQSGRFSYATAIGLFKSLIALGLLFAANSFVKKINGNSLF
jgi:putative aldouronate transport system permease protein